MAQADAGQLKLALEPVNLSAELDAMIEDARVLATNLRLSFEVQLPPHLQIEADRPMLHTALFNLISNAVKYNKPDGNVSIRLDAAGDKVIFEIGNTGPGIPEADQPRIFDRFFRVDHVKSARVEGIGLGLALAREIVRAHSGELLLNESRPGWTSFKVTIPTLPNQVPH